jgi:hypothetical protein
MARNDVLDCIEHTHSLSEFIDMGKSIVRYDYPQFCLKETIDGVPIIVQNVLDDYIEDLKNNCMWVKLTDKQVIEYRYNPKKLSYKLYETTLFYHIILRVNDICNVHEFTLSTNRLRLVPKDLLSELISEIYNAEKTTIYNYNNTHSNITSKTNITNDRLSGTI